MIEQMTPWRFMQQKTPGHLSRVLTHDGNAALVMLSVGAFDKLMHDAEEHRLDVRLKAAVEAYAAGERGIPLDEAFTQIREQTHKRPAAK